jgi:hypothetical protein
MSSDTFTDFLGRRRLLRNTHAHAHKPTHSHTCQRAVIVCPPNWIAWLPFLFAVYVLT